MTRDLHLILVSSTLRAVAVGALSIAYGLYLAALGLEEFEIGLCIAVGLAGMAAGTLIAGVFADRIGRRKSLVLFTLVTAGGGTLLALTNSIGPLLGASFIGMVNGMGRDRGPLQAIDQAVVAQSTDPSRRTAAFSRYSFLQDIGTAVGAFLGGMPLSLGDVRLLLVGYGAILCSTILLYRFLHSSVEVAEQNEKAPTLSPASRKRVIGFAGLSTLDSLGGGFITRSLLAYWFMKRFDLDPAWIGGMFAIASLVNAVAYFAAERIARWIGLLNTMVFTHIPSSLFLMAVAFAPNFPVAVVLFVLREFFSPMDVPTRQSYLAAIVEDRERTAAAGLVNMARNAAWVVGPTLAGWAMTISFSAPLFLAGGFKIVYDLSMWFSFRKVVPPEEQS